MDKRRFKLTALVVTALVLLCLLTVFTIPSCGRRGKPNVILISVDTLRADHLGCYGLPRKVSPNLDEFSQSSAIFENSFSASNYTLPSHASMLTSLSVASHRMTQTLNVLPPEAATVAELLKSNGYATAGFTGDTWVSAIFGFERGFDNWLERRYIRQLLPPIKKWVLKNRRKPFFVFFHFYDVHTPYKFRGQYIDMYHNPVYAKEIKRYVKTKPDEREKVFSKDENVFLSIGSDLTVNPTLMLFSPKKKVKQIGEAAQTYIRLRDQVMPRTREWKKLKDFPQELRFIVDSYDAGVRYTDEYLGNLFQFLKANGLWENTLIIVTSDHGEELMDHDLVAHFNYGYDTLIRVPLIMKFPDGKGLIPGKYQEMAEGVDVMPTILDLLDIKYTRHIQGSSLLASKQEEAASPKEYIFAATGDLKKHIIRSRSFKYIAKVDDLHKPKLVDYKFYDLDKDPDEKNNIIELAQKDEKYAPILKKHKLALKVYLDESASLFQKLYPKGRESSPIDEERMKHFKALGYMQ